MLRRRCRCILLIDVSRDPDHTLEELGNTIRKASIDLDAIVTFRPVKLDLKTPLPGGGLYASITYPARDRMPAAKGELLVIKPCLPDDVPTEVRAYAAGNKAFPHDTTANQFFGESQFESYRRLGEHLMARALGEETDIMRLFAIASVGKDG
jgi:hypothetical protein